MIERLTEVRESESGFTLVELLIALVIMGVAVVALVGALGTLVLSSTTHRGHSVMEAAAHSYTDAVERWANYNTPLTQNVAANDTVLHVADVSGFPSASNSNGFYVTVDQETMRVIGVSGGATPTLTVQRGQGGSPATTTHNTGTSVLPMLLCSSGASASYDQQGSADAYGSYVPPGYTPPTDVVATITSIEYWTGSAFTSYWSAGGANAGYGNLGSNGCLAYAADQCDLGSNNGLDIRPDCDPAVERLNIHLAPVAGNTSLRGVTTDTSLIIRRGSAR